MEGEGELRGPHQFRTPPLITHPLVLCQDLGGLEVRAASILPPTPDTQTLRSAFSAGQLVCQLHPGGL